MDGWMFEARLSCEGFTPAECGRFHYISQLWHFGNILTFIRPALLGHGRLQRRRKKDAAGPPNDPGPGIEHCGIVLFWNWVFPPTPKLSGGSLPHLERLHLPNGRASPPVTRKPGTARRAAWIPEWDKMGKRPQNRTTESVPVMAVVRGFIKATVKEKIPEDSINHVPVTELAEKNDSLRRCDEIEHKTLPHR
ncbi:hypothetical protein QC763_0016510 [Podospora pseudopauciseta]|uniref:Uncharacterized protein n=1 Tax=Podospora pseudopauciseta TaxID=2093780 RepID=A0ABR0HZZ7_9PEZI|nr:hypothetical protein QC763_0016510 [Podospora pseudopauciseta]